MSDSVRTIDAAGLKALLKERFEHPELYRDKHVFIWQAYWHDGIQSELVMDVMRQDFSKPKNERRIFRLISPCSRDRYIEKTSGARSNPKVGYLFYQPLRLVLEGEDIPENPLTLKEFINAAKEFLSVNGDKLPVVVYLPYTYDPSALDASHEQYIFTPQSTSSESD